MSFFAAVDLSISDPSVQPVENPSHEKKSPPPESGSFEEHFSRAITEQTQPVSSDSSTQDQQNDDASSRKSTSYPNSNDSKIIEQEKKNQDETFEIIEVPQDSIETDQKGHTKINLEKVPDEIKKLLGIGTSSSQDSPAKVEVIALSEEQTTALFDAINQDKQLGEAGSSTDLKQKLFADHQIFFARLHHSQSQDSAAPSKDKPSKTKGNHTQKDFQSLPSQLSGKLSHLANSIQGEPEEKQAGLNKNSISQNKANNHDSLSNQDSLSDLDKKRLLFHSVKSDSDKSNFDKSNSSISKSDIINSDISNSDKSNFDKSNSGIFNSDILNSDKSNFDKSNSGISNSGKPNSGKSSRDDGYLTKMSTPKDASKKQENPFKLHIQFEGNSESEKEQANEVHVERQAFQGNTFNADSDEGDSKPPKTDTRKSLFLIRPGQPGEEQESKQKIIVVSKHSLQQEGSKNEGFSHADKEQQQGNQQDSAHRDLARSVAVSRLHTLEKVKQEMKNPIEAKSSSSKSLFQKSLDSGHQKTSLIDHLKKDSGTIPKQVQLSRDASLIETMSQVKPTPPPPPHTQPMDPSGGQQAQTLPQSTVLAQPALSSQSSSQSEPTTMMQQYMEKVAEIQETASKQIVRGVHGSIGSGRSHITMRLVPEMLGRIHIQMTMENGTLSAHITAQKEATRSMLHQGLNTLRAAFEDQGIKVDRIIINKDSSDLKHQDQGRQEELSDKSAKHRSDQHTRGQNHSNRRGSHPKQFTPYWTDRMSTSDYFM